MKRTWKDWTAMALILVGALWVALAGCFFEKQERNNPADPGAVISEEE